MPAVKQKLIQNGLGFWVRQLPSIPTVVLEMWECDYLLRYSWKLSFGNPWPFPKKVLFVYVGSREKLPYTFHSLHLLPGWSTRDVLRNNNSGLLPSSKFRLHFKSKWYHFNPETFSFSSPRSTRPFTSSASSKKLAEDSLPSSEWGMQLFTAPHFSPASLLFSTFSGPSTLPALDQAEVRAWTRFFGVKRYRSPLLTSSRRAVI